MKFHGSSRTRRRIAPTREEWVRARDQRRRSASWLQCCTQFDTHSAVTPVTPQQTIVTRGKRGMTAPRILTYRKDCSNG